MGARRRRRSEWAGRSSMRSPGRPPVARREHRQRFWEAIARGLSSEDAGVAAGVSPAVGTRWFREAGGMPSISHAPLSGRYLSFAEREEIAVLHARDHGVREIARQLGRSPSTVSRELRRNAATRGGYLDYRATTAQWHADRQGRRPKIAKLAANQALRRYVQDRLAGMVTTTDGHAVPGPEVRWIGRRHGRRQDRCWATSWSPEQIAHRLRSISPMMNRCGSRTRRSTRHSTSKDAERCAASCPHACARGEHYASRGPAPEYEANASSHQRS
jgi:DNA-binding CsgD family transcriptional regulator